MPLSADAIETAVVDAIATACRLDAFTVTRSTRLAEACLDSLTLVAVLTQVEIACGIAFDADEIVEILRARDVGEIVGTVSRKIASID